jgi:EPS-associated MarR family transcriptional regulator
LVETSLRAVAIQLTSGLFAMSQSDKDLREDLRFRVLRLLEKQPQITYREIAKELDVSLGGVHYCLKALVDKGMVKIGNFRASDNKLRYAYILTPKGMSERSALASRFLKRKMLEYEALKSEIDLIMGELDYDPLSDKL